MPSLGGIDGGRSLRRFTAAAHAAEVIGRIIGHRAGRRLLKGHISGLSGRSLPCGHERVRPSSVANLNVGPIVALRFRPLAGCHGTVGCDCLSDGAGRYGYSGRLGYRARCARVGRRRLARPQELMAASAVSAGRCAAQNTRCAAPVDGGGADGGGELLAVSR